MMFHNIILSFIKVSFINPFINNAKIGKKLEKNGPSACSGRVLVLFLTYLHLQDEINIVLGQLGALRVAREFQGIRGDFLCLFLEKSDEEIDRIARDDICTNRLHEFPNRTPCKSLSLCHN